MIDSFFQYFSENDSPSRDLYYEQGGPKKYKRSPIITLPTPDKVTMSLTDSLMNRRSSRQFGPAPLLLEEMSTLLFWAFGEIKKDEKKDYMQHFYPSGGAKYALEFYPLVLKCDNVPAGVYHYNPRGHVLEHLFWVEHQPLRDSVENQFISGASMIVLISFVKSRHILK